MPPVPMSEWGRRLSDAIREALDRGDLASARRLALEGDGQARSLEKEYALMYKGLGITIRVLLAQLRDSCAETCPPSRDHGDMAALMTQGTGRRRAAGRPGGRPIATLSGRASRPH